MYQRVLRLLSKRDTTSHSYSSSTLRPWNNDATNAFEAVCGQTTPVNLAGQAAIGNATGQSLVRPSGIGTGDAAINQISVASVSTAGGARFTGYRKFTMNQRTTSGTGTFFNFVMQSPILC
jgi:hypothetical protein